MPQMMNGMCFCVIDKCANANCPSGFLCQIDGSGNAQCIDPCSKVTCPTGDQCKLGADIVARDDAPGTTHLRTEAGDHLREPLGTVGVPRAVLGVAVQRQVGEHYPEPRGQRLDQRLVLAVR